MEKFASSFTRIPLGCLDEVVPHGILAPCVSIARGAQATFTNEWKAVSLPVANHPESQSFQSLVEFANNHHQWLKIGSPAALVQLKQTAASSHLLIAQWSQEFIVSQFSPLSPFTHW